MDRVRVSSITEKNGKKTVEINFVDGGTINLTEAQAGALQLALQAYKNWRVKVVDVTVEAV